MKNLSSILDNLKRFCKENQNDLILVAGVVLISLMSFGAGRLTAPKPVAPEPIIIEGASRESPQSSSGEAENGGVARREMGRFVASINGTKYYLPECGGANRIKEENKIWFETREEAEKAGYGPAANCPGL